MPVIRTARLDEIIALRHAILRADTTIENAYFDEDRASTTHHFGVFEPDGRCVGCATFLAVDYEGQPAWQLRGMAVDWALRQSGIGRDLLGSAEAFLADVSPVRLMWCHARKVAAPFYHRCGWAVVSEEYEIIGIPHLKMTRRFGE